jgi:hypothetical protein
VIEESAVFLFYFIFHTLFLSFFFLSFFFLTAINILMFVPMKKD